MGSTVVLILFQCFLELIFIILNFFLCVKGKDIPVKFFILFFYKRTERGGKISVLLFCKAGNCGTMDGLIPGILQPLPIPPHGEEGNFVEIVAVYFIIVHSL